MDAEVLSTTQEALETCDLFMTIGTSSVVYPAAGFAAQVRSSGMMLSHAFGALHQIECFQIKATGTNNIRVHTLKLSWELASPVTLLANPGLLFKMTVAY